MADPAADDIPPESSLGDEERVRRQRTRRTMTPEERRFLATPRAAQHPSRVDDAPAPPPSAEETLPLEAELQTEPEVAAERRAADDKERTYDDGRRKARGSVMAQASAARSVELRHAFWAILVLVVLAMAFYVGKKFEYWRYQLASRAQGRAIESAAPDKFPNASANELIETALAAEKRGDWADAIERMMAAKRKNLAIPGLLFRVGKISFDHGDLQNADAAFAQAIRFKENVAGANYHRGVIAVRRNDLTSALQYFEAATAAEPFISEMYYFWAEALRIAQHPREAIQRYEQAIQRSTSENDVALCHFKIRLARIEAADAAGLARDIATERATGPLSVDWLMTDAALQLHYGNVADAIARIQEARSRGQTPLFLTCAGDTVFLKASQSHPDIATALNTTAAAP